MTIWFNSTLPQHRLIFLALTGANLNHRPLCFGFWLSENKQFLFYFIYLFTIRGAFVQDTDRLELLRMELSSDLHFSSTIESKAQTAAKKLGILHKVRRYFTPGHLLKEDASLSIKPGPTSQ